MRPNQPRTTKVSDDQNRVDCYQKIFRSRLRGVAFFGQRFLFYDLALPGLLKWRLALYFMVEEKEEEELCSWYNEMKYRRVPGYLICLSNSSFMSFLSNNDWYQKMKKGKTVNIQAYRMYNSNVFLSDWAGQYIFHTVFHKDFKYMDFVKIRPCSATSKLSLTYLLNSTEQGGWTELEYLRGWFIK